MSKDFQLDTSSEVLTEFITAFIVNYNVPISDALNSLRKMERAFYADGILNKLHTLDRTERNIIITRLRCIQPQVILTREATRKLKLMLSPTALFLSDFEDLKNACGLPTQETSFNPTNKFELTGEEESSCLNERIKEEHRIS